MVAQGMEETVGIGGNRVLISSEVNNGCAVLHVSRRGRELIINGHPNSRVDQSAGSEVFRVPSAQIAAAQRVRDN